MSILDYCLNFSHKHWAFGLLAHKKIGNLGISCTPSHGEAGQGPEEVAEHGDGGAEGVQVAEQRRQAAVLRHAAHRVLH